MKCEDRKSAADFHSIFLINGLLKNIDNRETPGYEFMQKVH